MISVTFSLQRSNIKRNPFGGLNRFLIDVALYLSFLNTYIQQENILVEINRKFRIIC